MMIMVYSERKNIHGCYHRENAVLKLIKKLVNLVKERIMQ